MWKVDFAANGPLPLTAFLGVDGSLVFEEVGDTLAVSPPRKPDLYRLLLLAFENVEYVADDTPDERLFHVLQALSDLGHWRSLDEVETWLLEHDIPFLKMYQDCK